MKITHQVLFENQLADFNTNTTVDSNGIADLSFPTLFQKVNLLPNMLNTMIGT